MTHLRTNVGNIKLNPLLLIITNIEKQPTLRLLHILKITFVTVVAITFNKIFTKFK